jgi:hydroxymethylpyrimidine/phosphomethylpyrimidine kinase
MAAKTAALLSIAGYDPTGGAGVLLDTAVFRRFGYQGLGIITSVTVQNTVGVRAFSCLQNPSVRVQYRALAEDIGLAGLKVGMLGCRENILPVARILREQRLVPRVIDPVLRPSSGRWLLEQQAIPGLVSKFRDLFTVWTPNMDEAGWLSGAGSGTLASMKEAAERIAGAAGSPVVVKGGHLPKAAVNVLYDGALFHLFAKPRLPQEVHGTGCFFSAALLTLLASGAPLVEAVRRTTDITHEAIREAVRLGRGRLVISPATLASSGRPLRSPASAGPHRGPRRPA